MKNLLVSLIVAYVSSTALAETYLCITEASGGVTSENEKWMGTKFSPPHKKYLVRKNEWTEPDRFFETVR